MIEHLVSPLYLSDSMGKRREVEGFPVRRIHLYKPTTHKIRPQQKHGSTSTFTNLYYSLAFV